MALEKQVHEKVTIYKAKDLVPTVCVPIAKNPSLPNIVMEKLLSQYGNTGNGMTVFTDNLLQSSPKLAREDVFGDPATHVSYAMVLKCELEKQGHDAHIWLLDGSETQKTIYNVLLQDAKAWNSSFKETKRNFCH